MEIAMFGRFKKKPEPAEPKATEEPKVTEEPTVTEESKPEVTEKPETPEKSQEAEEKPSKKTRKTKKQAKAAEDASPKSPQAPADAKAKRKPFVGIKEYSSISEIAESIDKELADTKSALGEYLRQLDDRRAVAEKTQRLYNVVAKVADKMPSKGNSNHVDLNGLEIVLDATVLNELTAIENVVRSHQHRLIALQKAREALQTLNKAGDTEGIKYIALEKEGIPEQILLKL
jgi:DNA mismatch repair ATPase MutL